MKSYQGILLSLGAVVGFSATANAVPPPPLDRPTPPACCADGYCYPNPTTFGWYQRRWRRWPTEALEPTPDRATAPSRLTPDLRPFDLPPVEEEDRRAPPPTQPPEREPEEGEETPGTEMPARPSVAPPAAPPAGATPPGRMLPFEDDAPGTEPTPLPFGDPTTPTTPTAPTPGIPLGQPPTGDLDPAPAPPFGSPGGERTFADAPSLRAGDRRAAPAMRPGTVPQRRAPSNDPPPTLPLSLAQASY